MSTKKPLVFFTSISDEFYHSMGASKLVASAKYFHPDIPFVVLGTDQVNAINPDLNFNGPDLFLHFMKEYEWVVRFDADSMITGELTELLEAIEHGQRSIIGVRNNNDFKMAGKDPGLSQHNVPIERYLNTGLIACKDPLFMEKWREDNLAYGKHLPFVCQTTYNNVMRSFDPYILDSEDKRVYYGVSGLFGTVTHWDSWKEIEVGGSGELILKGKQVKVLHHAGGFSPDKMGFYMFNKETRERLIEICGGEKFWG